jgi:hypothetical protein
MEVHLSGAGDGNGGAIPFRMSHAYAKKRPVELKKKGQCAVYA